ncbi:MAG: AAA family ATPase [Nanoarchaeota archaeon]
MSIESSDPKLYEIKPLIDLERENRHLRRTISLLQTELQRINDRPAVVAEVKSIYKNKAIIRVHNGNQFAVSIGKKFEDKIKVQDTVLAEQRSLTIIDIIEEHKSHDVEKFVIIEKPDTKWEELGGLHDQIRELKEVVELPLKNPEIFRELGIKPPKGVILHGPSGTGKTMLAKAVAASTNATFIEIIASELNQKFIGEGAKLVKDLFAVAREKSPTIIFIDEIDALAGERLENATSGEREVQRTFIQFLAEMDGFKSLDNVKIIAATNRIDTIDPALLRPGRFDRLVEVGMPNKEEREEIFKIHTENMNTEKISLSSLAKKTEEFSGADIQAVCTEAGYNALRDNRKKIIFKDFINAINKLNNEIVDEHVNMFG